MAFQLDPTLYQRYQPQPLQLPNMMPALQQFSQLRDMRDARKLRTREEKKSQKLNELYQQTGGNLRVMARQFGPIDAKVGFELINMANTQDKQKAEAQKQAFEMKQKRMAAGSQLASKYISQDSQKKVENFDNLRGFMQQYGIPEPNSWRGKTEYDSDVEADLQSLAQAGQGNQQSFAPVRYQQGPLDELNRPTTFNPGEGSYKRATLEDGTPFTASQTYTTKQTPEGYVQIPTRTKIDTAPAPIKNLEPAGKKKLELETLRTGVALKKLDLDLKTANKLASQGGQFKPTQYDAASYGIRMSEVETGLDKLFSVPGFDPTTITFAMMEAGPEILKPGPMKSYLQYQQNFINATLREESGAAIAESEFDKGQIQYFPQIGDKPENLAQKKANRQVKQAAFRAESGGAWGEMLKSLDEIRKPVKAPNTKVTPQNNKPSKEDSQLMEQYGF